MNSASYNESNFLFANAADYFFKYPSLIFSPKYSMFAHINIIKSLFLSMSHFISTIMIYDTVLRHMFHKIRIIDR
jgi:hypothetical protein